MTLSERVAARIEREGPLRFDRVMDLALYDPDAGFFAAHGGAGRAGGDFLTSPEVGPLFGTVVARALDTWWRELDRPDPFTFVEVGAGRGALARSVLASSPACLPALRYVVVERSERLRSEQADRARVEVRSDLPVEPFPGVILANELLDNLAVRLVERHRQGWLEVFVDVDARGQPIESLADAEPSVAERASRLVPHARPGTRIPIEEEAAAWLERALSLVERGRVVVIDYADRTTNLAEKPVGEWLRTYRAHERGGAVLEALGQQDITVEVAVDQLSQVREVSSNRSQAEFLLAHGIDELVAEGRRVWHARAHLGDLEAMKARSRIRESEALLDDHGLGRFRVLEWHRGLERRADPDAHQEKRS